MISSKSAHLDEQILDASLIHLIFLFDIDERLKLQAYCKKIWDSCYFDANIPIVIHVYPPTIYVAMDLVME